MPVVERTLQHVYNTAVPVQTILLHTYFQDPAGTISRIRGHVHDLKTNVTPILGHQYDDRVTTTLSGRTQKVKSRVHIDRP